MKKISTILLVVVALLGVWFADLIIPDGVSNVMAYPVPETATQTPLPTSTPKSPPLPTLMPPEQLGDTWRLYAYPPLGKLRAVCSSCAAWTPEKYQNFIVKFTWTSPDNGWNQHYGFYTWRSPEGYPMYEWEIPGSWMGEDGCYGMHQIDATVYDGSVPLYDLTWIMAAQDVFVCWMGFPTIFKG